MNRIASQLQLAAALVGSVTLAGCQHKNCCCCSTTCAATPIVKPAEPAVTAEEEQTPKEPEATTAPEAPKVPEPRKLEPISHDRTPWKGTRKDQRRTYRDITAHPAFAHAPDYSWLIGELQYVTLDKAWVVRYASVDEEDPYGGSVTLLEPRPLAGYKSGMLVRVEGQFVDPEARGARPPYRLHTIQPHDPAVARR